MVTLPGISLVLMLALTVLRLTDDVSDAAAALGAAIITLTMGLEMVATLLHKKAGEERTESEAFISHDNVQTSFFQFT